MIDRNAARDICCSSLLCLLLLGGSLIETSSAFQFREQALSFPSLSSLGCRDTTTALSVSSTYATSGSSSTISIAEDAPRDIKTMDRWATGCGVQKAEGLKYTNEASYGIVTEVGVGTDLDIPAGQPVLLVPGEMILTGEKARNELGPLETSEGLFERLQKTEDLPHFYLFLKVLKEYEAGMDSPWYYWLDSLPRYFANGSSMTHLCSDLLPPLVGNLVSLERVRFRQFFRALKHADCLSENVRSDKDLAKWAFAIVYTRSFPLYREGSYQDVQLVPVADLFNHGTETEVELQTDAEGNCVAVATRDVAAGSPLRMSYGDPTNPSFLFARYGFLDESSPATFCKIMLEPTPDLVDMGYDHSRMLFYKDTGEVSEEVWDVLLYHKILGSDDVGLLGGNDSDNSIERANDRQALYNAHMSGDYETKQAIHGKYYSETVAALQNHVDSFLGDLAELTELASYKDLNTHPRLPLLMAHNAFVRDTFLQVQARLLEY